MKATCPNSPDHKEFITVAHVMQEWVVDSEGNFSECRDDCLEVTHTPTKGNIWYCNDCNAIAVVE